MAATYVERRSPRMNPIVIIDQEIIDNTEEERNLPFSLEMEEEQEENVAGGGIMMRRRCCCRSVCQSWTLQETKHYFSVIIVLLAILISESARGVVLSSLSTGILAQGGTVADVGTAVSLFSFGRLLSTIPLSYWSERRSCRESMIFATVIAVLGQLMYALSAGQLGQTPLTLASRFVIGIGTGTLGVCRGYLASVSTLESRTRYLSYAGLFQFIGFSLSPVAGSISLGYGEPGWVMLILNVFLVFILLFLSESKTALKSQVEVESASPRVSAVGNGEDVESAHILHQQEVSAAPKPNVTESLTTPIVPKRNLLLHGFAVFMFLNVVLRGILADAETLGPVAQQILNTGDDDVVEDTGEYFVALGLVGCAMYVAIDPLMRFGISESFLFLVGIITLGIGSVFLVDIIHGTSWVLFTIGAALTWCIASPLCQTLTISTFSKILGAKPQAVWLSYLTAAGSLGRIIFPFFASRISQALLCTLHVSFCVASIALYLSFYGRARLSQ
jgi:MFS family permease